MAVLPTCTPRAPMSARCLSVNPDTFLHQRRTWYRARTRWHFSTSSAYISRSTLRGINPSAHPSAHCGTPHVADRLCASMLCAHFRSLSHPRQRPVSSRLTGLAVSRPALDQTGRRLVPVSRDSAGAPGATHTQHKKCCICSLWLCLLPRPYSRTTAQIIL